MSANQQAAHGPK